MFISLKSELIFPKDSKSLKILDIRLWEVGAKRRLNGTSKSEHTDRQTHIWTNRLIESTGPEGRCFENCWALRLLKAALKNRVTQLLT